MTRRTESLNKPAISGSNETRSYTLRSMWMVDIEALDRTVLHGRLFDAGTPISFEAAMAGLKEEPTAREAFTSALAAVPFNAFKWECPPVTSQTVGRPFEFVVLDAPRLDRSPDETAFSQYFSDEAEVVQFNSRGRDAILIAPCPRQSPNTRYVHLAAFLRGAPATQRDALWCRVGDAMEQRIGARPVWLSTAGGGVAWLHVRLDDRPKYYGHSPYRTAAP